VNGALMATAQWKCALHSDGRVFCWGNRVNGNESGQLGRGNTTAGPTPMPVTGIADAAQIAVGWQHACARRRNNTVVCWGSNVYGQLGDGTTTNRSTPVAVPGLTDVAEIHAGDFTTCARLTSGQIRCWGRNFYGGLGNGNMIDSAVPVPVTGITDAVQLSMGSDLHCARLASTQVHCWGRNLEGQLGDGFRTNRSIPYPVQTPASTPTNPVAQTGFTNVHANYFRGYGQTTPGSTYTWGWSFSLRPTLNANFATVVYSTRVQVFGEPIDTECEIRTDGRTYCRGRNEFGQIGNGAPSFTESSWFNVSADFSAIRLGRGYGTPCAVERSSGRVLCWGWTGNGSLLAAGIPGNTTRAFEVVMP
jgi:alpha-tubulin suppressor-like RCC1 family protein